MKAARHCEIAFAAAVALVSIACTSTELLPSKARSRLGPAIGERISRIVALRSTCGALESFAEESCHKGHIDGVDALVRATLEFRGYSVIDSERVNAVTFSHQRTVSGSVENGNEKFSEQSDKVGSFFTDAPPATQKSMLAELGADGVLSSRIWVGAGKGVGKRRDVIVQIRLMHASSSRLAWASRCRIEAGMVLNAGPIMQAARCAVDKSPQRTFE